MQNQVQLDESGLPIAAATTVVPVASVPTELVIPAPTEEPIPPVVEPVKEEPVPYVHEPTGIPFYDSAAVLLADKGISPTEAIKAIRDNDGTIPESLRSDMIAKLGAAQTQVIESGLINQVSNERADRSAVVDSIGGEDAWKQIAEWTKSDNCKMTKADTDAYNSMLAQGGVQAKLAASKIKEAFMADTTNNIPATGLLAGQSAAPVASSIPLISRAVYLAEKNAALNKGDMVTVQALEQRARHTMKNAPDSWRPITGRR